MKTAPEGGSPCPSLRGLYLEIENLKKIKDSGAGAVRDLCAASSARSITEMIFLDIKVLPRTADNMTRGRFIGPFNVTSTAVMIISLYCRRR